MTHQENFIFFNKYYIGSSSARLFIQLFTSSPAWGGSEELPPNEPGRSPTYRTALKDRPSTAPNALRLAETLGDDTAS